MTNFNAGASPTNFVNPLLMNYTPKTKIQEESFPFVPFYDDEKQIVYDMRQVSTKCRKSEHKKLPGGSVKVVMKNEIDDSKTVK
jgi:hypothetical protein